MVSTLLVFIIGASLVTSDYEGQDDVPIDSIEFTFDEKDNELTAPDFYISKSLSELRTGSDPVDQFPSDYWDSIKLTVIGSLDGFVNLTSTIHIPNRNASQGPPGEQGPPGPPGAPGSPGRAGAAEPSSLPGFLAYKRFAREEKVCPSALDVTSWCQQLLPNDQCHCFSTVQRNWADANKYCQSNNMKLVAIESGYENDLLYNELIKYGYGQQEFWTSGSNNNRNLAWTWESTGVPFSYVKWEPSQMTGASNAFQRNAVFNRVRHQGAAWSSAYAHELHFSICESGQFSF